MTDSGSAWDDDERLTQLTTQAKLIITGPDGEPQPYKPRDAYVREQTYGVWRLAVSTGRPRMDFMLECAARYPGPFWITYVMESEGFGMEPGRYHGPTGQTITQIGYFLHQFAPFLESDGRHHIWVSCEATDGIIVYDQHDFFYLYQQLDEHESALAEAGFTNDFEYPFTEQHLHVFPPRTDGLEQELWKFWDWHYGPLALSDTFRRDPNPVRRWWSSAKERIRLWRSRLRRRR